MKKVANFFSISVLFSSLVILSTGCLKDELVEDGLTGPKISTSPSIIELAGSVEATTSYNSSSVVAFDIGPNRDTLGLVYARLAADQPADKDIQVQLELVPSLIDAYNDSNATAYEPLPTDIYNLSSEDLTITIPKGSREGSLDINLIPNDLIDHEYAVGLRVKSVSDPNAKISGNFNNLVAIVLVKNIYDGEYSVTGTMIDNVNPALTGLFPMTIYLVTTGANSVAMFDPIGWHDFIHPISNAGNYSGYGSFAPQFEFDPSGNGTVVSVVNYFGQPAPANGRSAAIDPTGLNKWDPVTKEMKVKFFMLQPGTTVRTTFDETFEYVGPR